MRRDIPFASYPGFRPLSLDLHRPEASGAVPVILQLHGGGWRVGSRGSFAPGISDADSFGRMTAAGFAVAAADYRLSGEARYPAQLSDVERALDWVEGHAEEFALDPDRVVLWGGSAGGTLAALVGLSGRRGIRGVIDWYGPSDLLAMARHTLGTAPAGESREDRWLGSFVLDVPELAREASPVHRVRPGALPFHLAHGAADRDVPPAQSEALADALRAAGVPVELHLEPGAGHMWSGVGDTAPLFARALDFARRVSAD
ncbi:alpha/beta hydrolase [Galbitalea soli]|uniref:Alpha/beta hydrolase n=1 Tax=Galbitalea soli TaxID=1268042 RepID=A0A7C9PPK3_9MICO|nr:alpha/beta hydrolase [Galbitalea soli]